MMRTIISTLLLVAILPGCDGPVDCTRQIVPGITVEITDAETGEGLACEALVVVHGVASVDSIAMLCLEGWERSRISAVPERPGIYGVVVEVPGYEVWWQIPVIVVMEDECHVKTVTLNARMIREQIKFEKKPPPRDAEAAR